MTDSCEGEGREYLFSFHQNIYAVCDLTLGVLTTKVCCMDRCTYASRAVHSLGSCGSRFIRARELHVLCCMGHSSRRKMERGKSKFS